MNTNLCSHALMTGAWALRFAASLATIMVALSGASAAFAQATLAYSFEGDLQGFGANGGGVTIDLDTIGATDGANSMKVDIVAPATFVGALTANLVPEIGDPPGFDFIIYDLTITEQFPDEGFVSAGITIFGASQPDHPGGQLFGLQAQFFPDDEVPLGDLTVGTHEIRMELTSALHPLTFEPGSFNDIFGVEGSDPNDLIPTGFQIYINKSGTTPWTGYFDNIRVGKNPTLDADFNNDAIVDATDLGIWSGAFAVDSAGDADADGDSDGADFLIWQTQLGPVPPAAAVPEPTMLSLAGIAALAGAARRRHRP